MGKQKSANNKNWYSTFTRILSWKRITGVATILSLCVAIFVIFPENKANQLKKNINNYIEVIESDFHPQVLLHENDSSVYLKKMAIFQQLVLDYCSVLSTVNSYQDYTEFSYMDYENARVTVAVDLTRLSKADTLSYECFDALEDLLNYGTSIDPDYIIQPSISKRANIKEYKELKSKVSYKYLEKYTELMNKHLYAKSVNALNTDDFIGFALKEINKLVNDADFYKYDEAVLEYFIDANKLLKLSKRNLVIKELRQDENSVKE